MSCSGDSGTCDAATCWDATCDTCATFDWSDLFTNTVNKGLVCLALETVTYDAPPAEKYQLCVISSIVTVIPQIQCTWAFMCLAMGTVHVNAATCCEAPAIGTPLIAAGTCRNTVNNGVGLSYSGTVACDAATCCEAPVIRDTLD